MIRFTANRRIHRPRQEQEIAPSVGTMKELTSASTILEISQEKKTLEASVRLFFLSCSRSSLQLHGRANGSWASRPAKPQERSGEQCASTSKFRNL
jgi:hypothetical protein